MSPNIITYHYRGPIERPTKRGYVWREGYSESSVGGLTLYPWSTKKEAREEARSQGAKAVFVDARKT